MITALNITMIGLLFWIFYEDVKERSITLVLMILLLVIGGYLNYTKHIIELFLISSLINLLTVSVVVLILWLYSKLKLRTELFKVFGTGDLLFFLFMVISFPTTTFLVMFSSSLVFSFVISLVLRKKMTKWIPLAGLQALFLGLIVGVNQVFGVVNLYML